MKLSLEIPTAAGVPFPVAISLHNRTKSRGSESFKTLAPNGQPIKTQMLDSDGNVVERDATSKGVEVSKGEYVALTPEAVESISGAGKTEVAELDSFAPLDSIPLELALTSYSVTANTKVPGSDKSVAQLWNGLRAAGVAYVTQATLTSRDVILAVYATDRGLFAAALPFRAELNDAPTVETAEDAEVAAAFKAMVVDAAEVKPFDQGTFESQYKARRDEAVQSVLAGKPVAVAAAPQQTTGAPDLMAALSAATEKAKGKAVTAKTAKSKVKVTA